MILTIDTNKKTVQVGSRVKANDLFIYLKNQYGEDWVNYSVVPSRVYRSDTFIENNYYPEQRTIYPFAN